MGLNAGRSARTEPCRELQVGVRWRWFVADLDACSSLSIWTHSNSWTIMLGAHGQPSGSMVETSSGSQSSQTPYSASPGAHPRRPERHAEAFHSYKGDLSVPGPLHSAKSTPNMTSLPAASIQPVNGGVGDLLTLPGMRDALVSLLEPRQVPQLAPVWRPVQAEGAGNINHCYPMNAMLRAQGVPPVQRGPATRMAPPIHTAHSQASRQLDGCPPLVAPSARSGAVFLGPPPHCLPQLSYRLNCGGRNTSSLLGSSRRSAFTAVSR